MTSFYYGLRARPASPGAIPAGLSFEIVDATNIPDDWFQEPLALRKSVADTRHGLMITDEPITDEHISQYELIDLNPKPKAPSSAIFISDVTVIDPETKLPVQVSIYKDLATGGVFGVDTSYVTCKLEDGDTVHSVFDGSLVLLEE